MKKAHNAGDRAGFSRMGATLPALRFSGLLGGAPGFTATDSQGPFFATAERLSYRRSILYRDRGFEAALVRPFMHE